MSISTSPREIMMGLYRAGLVETVFHCRDPRHGREGWTLKSGIWSPLYINLRPIGAHPELLLAVGSALAALIRERCPDAELVLGVHMAGIPLATAAVLAARVAGGEPLRLAYTRPFPGGRSPRTVEEARDLLARGAEDGWGGHRLIEGDLHPGCRVVILDDIVTGFGSKLIARELLEHEARVRGIPEVICRDVVVVLDREQGAAAEAERQGMGLHSLIRLRPEGLAWLEGLAPAGEIAAIRAYLEDPGRFQDPAVRAELLARAERSRRAEGGR